MEQIYTIPVNEAFDKSLESPECGCPFCTLYKKLQNEYLELILGASMMEPDIRKKTNLSGFCSEHFNMMLGMKNRLGIALILESHLDELRDDIGKKFLNLFPGENAKRRINNLEKSCYVCERIDFSLTKMFETALLLYEKDSGFKNKFSEQPYFCLPHFNKLITLAKAKMPKKLYGDFYDDASKVVFTYFDTLRPDIKHFIKKFDYRYEDEPWGNSKDSIERAIKFLCTDSQNDTK